MNHETEDRNPVEFLGEEFLSRRRRGEPVTAKEYMRDYPELADEIRRQFPIMVALEKFKSCALSSSDETVNLDVGTVEELGDYRIIREIGRGGMGIVYEAEQQSLRRRVAVKVFPRQSLSESRQLERFRREAQTAAALHHTNIVPVFGVGQDHGLHYFVMQRIDGVGLDAVVSEPDGTFARHHAFQETLQKRMQSGSTAKNSFGSEHGSRSASSTGPLDVDTANQIKTDSPGTARYRDDRHPPASETIANRIAVPDALPDVVSDAMSDAAIAQEAADTPDPMTICRDYRSLANIGVQVADALAYAHSQGVLHRDIKPSNLMLDAGGTVWVTDFGLATMMMQSEEERQGDVAGTLRFMAPEQLSSRHDARSDIYSLGVTLYELLIGKPAFDDHSRAKIIDRILKGSFKKPRAIRPEIPRDLESIVLKAMACDPDHRYQTANELEKDLQRFIDARPVQSRRNGSLRRTLLWTRRNPAVACLAGILFVGACTSMYLISSKWREAVAERYRAEGNLSLALESMDQILNRFTTSWMAYPIAPDTESPSATDSDVEFQFVVSNHSAELMQDALKFYDQFAEQNATNPRLQRDTAKVHQRIADIYQRLGQYRKAAFSYAKSLAILDEHGSGHDVSCQLEKASTLNQLGISFYAMSEFEKAEETLLKARDELEQGPFCDDPMCQAELVTTYRNLGQSQWRLRKHQGAKESHGKAISISESLVEQHPDNATFRLELARTYRHYYPYASSRSRIESERIKSAGIEILEQLVADHPKVPDYQCELSEWLTTTDYRSRWKHDLSRHIARLQRGTDIARELTHSHPSIPRYRAVLAKALKQLAWTLERSEPDVASDYFNESISIYRALANEFDDIPVYHFFLAMSLKEYAQDLRSNGQLAEARQVAEEGIEEHKQYLSLRIGSQFGFVMLARHYEELARTLSQLDEHDEAKKANDEASRIRAIYDMRNLKSS